MLAALCFILMSALPASSLEVMPPMNQIYHPVSTNNPEAQKYFNKGLTYLFAYNHDVAFDSFKKASEQDPNLAMAYWGMAMALGQNVNTDVTPENEIKCYNYVQQALKLAPKASQNDQDYINALKVRYTNDSSADLVPLRYLYRNAMKKVVEAYPEDLDAATLYSESILELNPWKWWTYDGKPTEGVYEAADVLDSVLKRAPNHIGANHFYIHAFEESPFPERALLSAYRLETLLPESGHLLHMPCHIFLIVGDYKSALSTNTKALAADSQYIKEHGMGGEYPLHYFKHNLYVMVRIHELMNDFEKAYATSLELVKFIEPYVKSHQLDRFAYVPFEVLLYFHKWKEILEYQPIIQDSPIVNSYQHFSRAMAYAVLGKLNSAEEEKKIFLENVKKIQPTEEIAGNPASQIFKLAELVLNATINRKNNNLPASIEDLQKAIYIQDRLNYDEPPPWYIPVREELGATYLLQQRWKDAADTFQEALTKLRCNGRLLYFLALSLKAQQKVTDAYWVEREMVEAFSK